MTADNTPSTRVVVEGCGRHVEESFTKFAVFRALTYNTLELGPSDPASSNRLVSNIIL